MATTPNETEPERFVPDEEEFDPSELEDGGDERVFRRGVELFDAGDYHAAHEEFEKLWLNTQGPDSEFYKGLIQACIALHHYRRENLEGARKLYRGHRGLLAGYLPSHRGLELERFLVDMQAFFRPVLRASAEARVAFDMDARPRLSTD